MYIKVLFFCIQRGGERKGPTSKGRVGMERRGGKGRDRRGREARGG